jgi:hypothetical protein
MRIEMKNILCTVLLVTVFVSLSACQMFRKGSPETREAEADLELAQKEPAPSQERLVEKVEEPQTGFQQEPEFSPQT